MDALIAQTAPDLEVLAGVGVGAVIIIALIAILAQVGLSYLAQRNLNDQLSLGIQAVVGANNLRIVDSTQEDAVQRQDQNGNQ